MDNSIYATLARQSGLLKEMTVVANNVANASTAGYRREGLMFAEFVKGLGDDPSLSMATPMARSIDLSQGPLRMTGGTYDFAIEGDGFFLVETPEGNQLTRAGSFSTNEAGELVTMDGRRVLDIGQAPIFIPPDAPGVAMARDGTLSAGGLPLGQIGVFTPTDPLQLSRRPSGLFASPAGVDPVDQPVVLQGFVEQSNVNPIAEITRMIEVQHAYEQGQKFLDREDERIRSVIQTLGR